MSKDTFEQKIRLIALEDRGEDTAIVKVSDLVELLSEKEELVTFNAKLRNSAEYWMNKYDDVLSQALKTKPCSCSKHIDLRG